MAENYGTLEGTLDEHGVLSGEMSDRATLEGEIQFGSGGGGVLDVFQNGQSVVQGRYAYVTVPTFLRELRSDDYHNTVTTLEIQKWNGKADPSDIPTALSQLDNDANYVQDADYVHTDNNFTDEDKAAIGGIPENITDLSDVAVDNIQNGQVLKWDATQNKFVNANESGGGGDITDVKVDGISVVDPVTGEADIDLSGKADKALDAVAGDFAVLLANGNYANSGKSANDMASKAEMSVNTSGTQTTVQLKNGTSAIINNPTITIQKNGQNVDTFTLNQTANKVIDISVPTKTSDLQNDSSFIDNTVNNLANYYLKTQTYTQAEVDALIDAAINGRFKKVTVLPATGEPNIIYLVPKATPETSNACDEYIWQDNDWELIGSTNIDLSGYVTDDELTTALQDYLTTSAFNTAIANYYTKTEVGNLLDDKVDKISGKGLSTNDYDNTAKGIVDGVTAALADKVDKETGKGLSTNDYTTNDKNKLAGIAAGATKTASSTTNGNIKINDVETQVYDDSEIQDKIDETTTSISGNPISISGLKANQLAINPIITFEPIQAGSGTPSPSNVRAISGYDKIEVLSGGKNILDLSKLGSYQVTASGTMRYGVPAYLKAGTYTFSKSGGSATLYLTNVTDNYSYVEIGSAQYPYTFSVNANSYVIFRTSGNTPSDWDIVNAQLEEGSSATTYVPYNKATSISESLGQTVYGGTLDVRTGKLTVDRKIVDMGNLSWSAFGSSYPSIFYAEIIDGILSVTLATGSDHGTCEIYAVVAKDIVTLGDKECTLGSRNVYNNRGSIMLKDTTYTDATTLKTAVTGYQLVYELATPFTIQLTPHEISLLKDYAYVSTNGTNIALDYHNGELASLADVSQLGETVNELGEYIGANNKGTDVDLSLYTSQSSSYQFPKDGYIVVYGGSATSGNIYVALLGNDNGNFGGIYMNITGTSQMQTTFVKKGMRAYLGSKTASASNLAVVYRPLV